ncbi:hypothetical protein HNY73_002188 [Argiope bruennichi]|uniref:Uncharacterized protein n=1 Tax=Argiope bruennichi TaxID=94029 RepID=A0A8T0FSQ3_ARGBR|nr:hypothetical protein HNY73_002188 [Argiope bruennichi]
MKYWQCMDHIQYRLEIVKWFQQLEYGRTDFIDMERQRRPTTVSTSDMVQRVEDNILSNSRVSIAHIAQDFGISVGSAHSIVRH